MNWRCVKCVAFVVFMARIDNIYGSFVTSVVNKLRVTAYRSALGERTERTAAKDTTHNLIKKGSKTFEVETVLDDREPVLNFLN